MRTALLRMASVLACFLLSPVLAQAGHDSWSSRDAVESRFNPPAPVQVLRRTDSMALGANIPVLFVSRDCRGCGAAISALQQRGQAFVIRDVSRDPQARQAMALLGVDQVPALVFERNVMLGFSGQAWRQAQVHEAVAYGQAMQGQGP